jgi:hypothetical protein
LIRRLMGHLLSWSATFNVEICGLSAGTIKLMFRDVLIPGSVFRSLASGSLKAALAAREADSDKVEWPASMALYATPHSRECLACRGTCMTSSLLIAGNETNLSRSRPSGPIEPGSASP